MLWQAGKTDADARVSELAEGAIVVFAGDLLIRVIGQGSWREVACLTHGAFMSASSRSLAFASMANYRHQFPSLLKTEGVRLFQRPLVGRARLP